MDWLSLKCPGDFQISWSLAQIKGNNWWRMLLPGRQGKTDRDDWSDPIYASLLWCLGGDVVGFDGSKGTTVNHKGIILFSICLFKKAPSLWVIKIHFRWVYLCWDLSWFSGDRSLRNCDETAIALLQMLNVHWVWHQWCTIFHAFRTFSGGGGIDLTDLVMALAQTSQICINLRQRSILSGIRKKTCVGCRNF